MGDDTVELGSTWLRDRATGADSRDPVSGQRLSGITDPPPDLGIESATVRDEWLDVVFTPGRHRATYDVAGLLEDVRRTSHDDRSEGAERLWRTAADLGPVTRVL